MSDMVLGLKLGVDTQDEALEYLKQRGTECILDSNVIMTRKISYNGFDFKGSSWQFEDDKLQMVVLYEPQKKDDLLLYLARTHHGYLFRANAEGYGFTDDRVMVLYKNDDEAHLAIGLIK